MNFKRIEEEIFNHIEVADSIIVVTHKNPDFDAIGSQIGLKLALLKRFPRKKIYATGDSGRQLQYDSYKEEIDDAVFINSLVILVDTPAKKLIGDIRALTAKTLIKIDHHQNSESFGDVEYLDDKTIAAAQIVTRFLMNYLFDIDKDIAYFLLMGIIGDSGRFRYSGVNNETYELCGLLMSEGVDMQPLFSQMYAQSQRVKRFVGYIASNFSVTNNGVAYIKITLELLLNMDPKLEELGKGFVNTLSDIKGCPIWTEFVEQEDGITVELRSSDIKVNDIATKFGGGGHALAAGALVHSWDEVDAIIATCDAAIAEQESK